MCVILLIDRKQLSQYGDNAMGWTIGVRFPVEEKWFFSLRRGIAQWYSAGLRAGWSGVRVPAEAGNFSLHHRVQTGSGAHPASYPVGTRGSSLGVKRLGCEADHSPPSSVEVKEWVELYVRSPNTPSWRGAQLRKERGQLYLILFN
jgi:hypothetical protein